MFNDIGNENILPPAPLCKYTLCYCEENVWNLCDYISSNNPQASEHCYCVFISNTKRVIPLWGQKISPSPEKPVFWDYHVIFIYKGNKVQVYDLDSSLHFPCSMATYTDGVICSDDDLEDDYKRMFRVIPARTFLDTFSSDRSHMKKPDGTYQKPPPPYPPIQSPVSSNNIQEFISMERGTGQGTVMNFREFYTMFS